LKARIIRLFRTTLANSMPQLGFGYLKKNILEKTRFWLGLSLPVFFATNRHFSQRLACETQLSTVRLQHVVPQLFL
jgi:hypothetical protein